MTTTRDLTDLPRISGIEMPANGDALTDCRLYGSGWDAS